MRRKGIIPAVLGDLNDRRQRGGMGGLKRSDEQHIDERGPARLQDGRISKNTTEEGILLYSWVMKTEDPLIQKTTEIFL